jgi:hypothetical protein
MNYGFYEILGEIFETYADADGLLSVEAFQRLVQDCGQELPDKKDIRVLFANKAGVQTTDLTFKGWLNVYTHSCHENPDAVYDDIAKHGYRTDFELSFVIFFLFLLINRSVVFLV